MSNNSGRLINYTLRPAKCIERKIMCEFLSKFKTEVPIHKYRYIGFGAFYFSDFVLFHNALSIDKMISIEKSSNTNRYEFNKPYKCIEMVYGQANHVISEKIPFPPSSKDIVWLDYDGDFNNDVLNDLILVSTKIRQGSFVFTSFNTSIAESEKLTYLRKFCAEYISPKISEKDITKQTLPSIFYSIIDAAIQKSIMARNIRESEPILAYPVFFVKYRDNAEMVTIGYYFDFENSFDLSQIEELPWYPRSEKPYSIYVPCFTKAEIREINKFLPGSSCDEIHTALPYLARSDIEKYIDMYKYYPNFLDSQYYV